MAVNGMLVVDGAAFVAVAGRAGDARGVDAGAASESWVAGGLLALGVIVLTVVSLRIWRRKRRMIAARRGGAVVRERFAELSRETDRDRLETLMVEVQELTRSCAAQLDNRQRQLDRLVAEADERLAELRRAVTGPSPAAAERESLGGSASKDGSAGGVSPAVRAGVSVGRGAASGEEPRDPIAERIIALSAGGANSTEIAARLNEQVGKVELILSMASRRSA